MEGEKKEKLRWWDKPMPMPVNYKMPQPEDREAWIEGIKERGRVVKILLISSTITLIFSILGLYLVISRSR